MKLGFRTPSFKKKVAARTSWKRYVRHSLGVKMPKGYGFLSQPKKGNSKEYEIKATQENISSNDEDALEFCPYSFVDLINSPDKFGQDGMAKIVFLLGFVSLFFNPLLACLLLISDCIWLCVIVKSPWYKVKINTWKAKRELRANRAEVSVPLLKKAIKLDNYNSELLYMLGVAQYMVGNIDESIISLERYTELHTADLDAKVMLAYDYYIQEQYTKVIPILQKIPQEYPSNLLIISLLGDSFLSIKKYELAIEVFKRAPLRKRNLDNTLLQLHYHLAMAYKGDGQNVNALKSLKRVYAFDINYRDVAQEIEELSVDV